MLLTPFLPIIDGESLASYMARVAHFHADMNLESFLRFIELPQSSLMKPDYDTIERLSVLLGVPTPELERMTFISLGGRMRRFCGEEVHSEFANLDMTSYCPACLIEDAKADGNTAGHRVGRINWMIEHCRTCDTHKIPLVRRMNTARVEKLQQMSFVAPNDEALMRMVESAPRQRASGLQLYVNRRLAGKSGPDWLDSQPIDLAARTCEMIGVILTAGAHVKLKLLSDADWNIAGHVGFGFARRGQAGVEEALQLAKQRFDDAGLNGGPQKALGRLYQWLQFNSNGKPLGPVREIVRNFVLHNFSIEVGADLMGETVKRRRVHSVHSLAKETGDHPRTVNRALVLSGLMEGDPDKVCGNRVCDADAAEALMQRVRNSIPVTKLPTYLNCNRVQAQQFVRSGLIPRLLTDTQRASGVMKQVALEDVDTFLSSFLAAADQKQSASDSLMDVVSASEVARWPVLEIVNGILAGLFQTVEIVDVSMKFKGVLVDPREIREVLARQQSQGRVGLDEASRIVGMPKSGVSALVRLLGRDGEPYVREYWAENSKGAKTRFFDRIDLERFRSDHISLKEIAANAECAPKSMKMRLVSDGIDPVAPKYELGRIWYRRCDVSGY